MLKLLYAIRLMRVSRNGLTKKELAQQLECSERTVERFLIPLSDALPVICTQEPNGRKRWKIAC
jgi:predicted DNA-binding transcriptional regulator YafY